MFLDFVLVGVALVRRIGDALLCVGVHGGGQVAKRVIARVGWQTEVRVGVEEAIVH